MSDVIPSESKVSLYFTEGSSDKEYHAQLRPDSAQPEAWRVDFQYGRRGQALKSGTKTPAAIDFVSARKIYDKLVAEKMKGGYTPDVSGAVFQDTIQGEQFSGCLPQLPQVIRDEAQIATMVEDPAWWAQEKHDGENRQVRALADGTIQGINKRGIIVALPQDLADGLANVPSPFLASGELVGDTLHLFDVQELGGVDLRGLPYSDRYARIQEVVDTASASGARVVAVEAAQTHEQKRALVDTIRERSGEGVVFKRATAAFIEGKLSATQADQFKWKFTEDCTVRVRAVSKGKRSIEMEIDGSEGPLSLGSVTVPSNQEIPVPGALVSVCYLYLYEGGSLFQPQYKGVRTDCDGTDTLDQFKIKPKQPRRTASP